MKGWQVSSHVHPSKLTIKTDVPEPKPREDDVIVDVYSTAMNFFDILQAQGKHQTQPTLPFILGIEFSGRIAAHSPIPKGCTYKPGDRVFGGSQGAYAERIAVRWRDLYPIPPYMTFDEAAGLYITYPTSYEALLGRAELKPGEWVLVHAAAGGVGISAVQIAKAVGAKVIAAGGSTRKLEMAKLLGGADHALNYKEPGWQQEIMRITGGKGVDVIYDPVGLIRDSLKCVAWKGRAVVVGFAAGNIEKLPLNLVLVKNIAVTGIHWGAYTKFEQSRILAVWRGLFEMFASGKVVPVVYEKIWTLDELPQALDALERRETYGKVIVHVRVEDAQTKL